MVVTEEHLLGLAGLFRVETEVHLLGLAGLLRVETEVHLLGLAGLFRVETEVHSLDEASPDCIPCEKGQPEHSVTRQESTCHLLKLCGILRG